MRYLALFAPLLLGCERGTAPTPPIPLTVGAFVLEKIDGNALPQHLEFAPSTSCDVTGATLELYADTTFTWDNRCAPSGGTIGIGFFKFHFIQVAQDSIVIPAEGYLPPAPPYAHARKRGDSLMVFVDAWSQHLGGEHLWLFRSTAP